MLFLRKCWSQKSHIVLSSVFFFKQKKKEKTEFQKFILLHCFFLSNQCLKTYTLLQNKEKKTLLLWEKVNGSFPLIFVIKRYKKLGEEKER